MATLLLLLNVSLELYGLDVESLVVRVVDRSLRGQNITLAFHRREDLTA
jgi:hypothetical protein